MKYRFNYNNVYINDAYVLKWKNNEIPFFNINKIIES